MKKKEIHAKMLTRQLEGTHKPHVNRKSLEMVKTRPKSFLERLEEHNRRQNEKVPESCNLANQLQLRKAKEEEEMKEAQFDHQPSILDVSRKMKGRSWAEMSTGEQARRDARLEAARYQLLQKEVEGVTFKPKINYHLDVESKLKVATDPDSYLKRLEVLSPSAIIEPHQKERAYKEAMLQYEREKKELAIISQCTFSPETHEVPEYLKKISKQMRASRKQKEHTLKPTKR